MKMSEYLRRFQLSGNLDPGVKDFDTPMMPFWAGWLLGHALKQRLTAAAVPAQGDVAGMTASSVRHRDALDEAIRLAEFIEEHARE